MTGREEGVQVEAQSVPGATARRPTQEQLDDVRVAWHEVRSAGLQGIEAVAPAFAALSLAIREVEVRFKDFAAPPSRERRELRLIARAERAEAQAWWERHKANRRASS